MEEQVPPIVGLLIVANIIVSIIGFRRPSFFERYAFEVDGILIGRQYDRLVVSGFLHLNWAHLLFNMFALYSFGGMVNQAFGPIGFLTVYFVSLLAGHLLALHIHRQQGDYSSAGASGAISGMIFAFVVMMPDARIRLFLLPIGFPAWLFGVAYLLFTLHGIKSRRANIGHEAHLGGTIAGILLAVIFHPSIVPAHPVLLAALLLPISAFMYLLARVPHFMLIDNFARYESGRLRELLMPRKKIPPREVSESEELDRLLEKVSKIGYDKLSRGEKARLGELSKGIS